VVRSPEELAALDRLGGHPRVGLDGDFAPERTLAALGGDRLESPPPRRNPLRDLSPLAGCRNPVLRVPRRLPGRPVPGAADRPALEKLGLLGFRPPGHDRSGPGRVHRPDLAQHAWCHTVAGSGRVAAAGHPLECLFPAAARAGTARAHRFPRAVTSPARTSTNRPHRTTGGPSPAWNHSGPELNAAEPHSRGGRGRPGPAGGPCPVATGHHPARLPCPPCRRAAPGRRAEPPHTSAPRGVTVPGQRKGPVLD
jgi:hypothetical protein